MYDVFISYELGSSKIVKTFEKMLTGLKFITSVNDDGCKIEPKIFNSNMVIFFLTKKYFDCENNKFELNYSQMIDKEMVFVYLEKDIIQNSNNNNCEIEINAWDMPNLALFNQLIELIKQKKNGIEYSQNTLDFTLHQDDYVIENEDGVLIIDEDSIDFLK